jgi:hypothetical protein
MEVRREIAIAQTRKGALIKVKSNAAKPNVLMIAKFANFVYMECLDASDSSSSLHNGMFIKKYQFEIIKIHGV